MPDLSFQGPSALESALAGSPHVEQFAEALRISETRYRRLFETSRDGILILDSDLGTITDANPFISELLGYSNAELIGKELWEIGLLADKVAAQDAFQHLKTDGYIRYSDLPLYNRNGEPREVEFISNLYSEDGVSVIQCNIREITHSKRIESELAAVASENAEIAAKLAIVAIENEQIAAKLAILAIEKEQIAINLADIATVNERIADEKEQIAAKLAITATEKEQIAADLADVAIVNKRIAANLAVVADEKEQIAAKLADVATVNEKIAADLAVVADEKEQIAAELALVATKNVQIAGELATIASSNALTAETIQISERRYRRLFETARDGILLLNSESGVITDSNPFMSELLGYTHDELIGKELWEIGLLKDKGASQEAFQILKREGYIRYEDLPLRNREGAESEVEFVSNLYRENGHTVIQCNIRDITSRKEIETQLAIAADKNERIAETLQRSLLQTPPADQFPGFVVHTMYEAAMDESLVGGDFFDTFELMGGRIAFVVGDVSGKGLVAAGRTAEAKFALRAFLHGLQSPETAFADLNDFVCETYRRDPVNSELYIVLALAVVDTVTGNAIFLAAGAEPPVILRADGKIDIIEASGRAIGIMTGAQYSGASVVLGVGDTIIMATDGISEARIGYDFLGIEGMAELAEKVGAKTTLSELALAIYEGAKMFANGKLRDDVCMLLARRQ